MTEKPASWSSVRDGVLADPETRVAYDRLEERMRIVRVVIAARTAHGWSQRDLAEAAGLKQPAVARFERADSDPRLGTVSRICEALGLAVSVDPTPDVEPRVRRAVAAAKIHGAATRARA